jgi:hypothetical protein
VSAGAPPSGGALPERNFSRGAVGAPVFLRYASRSAVDGSLIAIQRDIALSPGLINGQVCGDRKQSYVSGSAVQCPPAP